MARRRVWQEGKEQGIDEGAKETTTPIQERFTVMFLRELRRSGFVGNVYMNAKIPVRRDGILILRAPDLFIPSLGLVIEIDGSAHDFIPGARIRERWRDDDWNSTYTGTYVLRLENHQLAVGGNALARIRDILEYIGGEMRRPDFRKRSGSRRAQLCRKFKQFAALDGGQENLAPSSEKMGSSNVYRDPELPGARPFHCGYVFRFSSRRPKRNSAHAGCEM